MPDDNAVLQALMRLLGRSQMPPATLQGINGQVVPNPNPSAPIAPMIGVRAAADEYAPPVRGYPGGMLGGGSR